MWFHSGRGEEDMKLRVIDTSKVQHLSDYCVQSWDNYGECWTNLKWFTSLDYAKEYVDGLVAESKALSKPTVVYEVEA